jgi:transposase
MNDDSEAVQPAARVSGGRAPDELSEREIQELVARCPEQQRWAFEGWLRGVRQLDGDPIVSLAP